jgi:serine/threonine protein kinase
MELGGENLLTLINRLRAEGQTFGPTLDLFTIKEFWRQMVSIVYTLQRNGIVHMDLKPDNLILFGSTLKIVDLGISRKVNVAG